jgi:Leucine-rich repeat (LRR) protein
MRSLVALYLHTSGAHWLVNNEEWVNKDLWLETNTPCSWAGICCDHEHVTESSLRVNGLAGDIPQEIGNLTYLTMLDLSDNNLIHVPPEIGKLTKLVELGLGFNKLRSLSPEIGNLTGLISLHVSSCFLSCHPILPGQPRYEAGQSVPSGFTKKYNPAYNPS